MHKLIMVLRTLFVVYISTYWTYTCPINCVCLFADSMQCTGTIPKDIPRVQRVTITNPPEQISSEMFAGLNWNNISQLTINCDPNKQDSYNGRVRLKTEVFKELVNLKDLSVTNVDQYIKEPILCDSFKGIEGITSLNLQGNLYFDMYTINCAILTYLHNLQTIRLTDLDFTNRAHIDTNFLLAIEKTSVRFLDVSGLVFGPMDFDKVREPFPLLETLIWRRCNNLFTFGVVAQEANYGQSVESIHTLDISGGTIIQRNWNIKFSHFGPNFLVYRNIKVFKLNNIFDEVYIYAGTLDLSGSRSSTVIFHWEQLELMHNGLQWLNFAFTDQFPFLNILNIAYNNISFVSPLIAKSSPNIKILNASHNTLGKMENMAEFSDFLVLWKNLEQISLSSNGLSKLPRSFFRYNQNMTVIDLSRNNLDHISFQFEHLKNLKDLDLRNNRLKTINPDFLSTFQYIRERQLRHLKNKTALIVTISNNPLVCGCDSLSKANFENIIEYSTLFGKSQITCNFEDSQLAMTKESTEIIHKTCQRKQIMIIVPSAVAFIIVVSIATFLIARRLLKRYRKKRHLLDLIELYKDVNKEPDFLVFLSYSSVDAKFVDETVYPQLEGKLQERLQTDKELVFNGDLHFQAGRRIEDEIVKAVESCKVVVLLISEAFCSSSWCDYETMVSYYEKKPIILMLKEDVPETVMPSILRKLFKRYVRAMWKNVNGTMTLRPGLDKLCQSILDQADL